MTRSSRAGGIVLLVAFVVLGLAVVVRLAAPEARPGTAPARRPATGPATGPATAPATGPESGPPGLPDDVEPARVVGHVDGDTLRVAGERDGGLLPHDEETAVRLLEIDAPETGRSGGPKECYADQATAALAELAPLGAVVWVERDRDLHDPYGRMLLYLWTGDGEMVNLALVRDGMARAVLFEPNDRHIGPMRGAEAEARADRRGMWAACG